MAPDTPAPVSLPVDEVRRELCEQLALLMKDGTVGIRLRLHPQTTTVWLSTHQNNSWQKRKTIVYEPAPFAALQHELDLLAASPHRDQLELRQQSASDWKETDFFFNREEIEPYINSKLASHLEGILFRDRHDSRQDVRRNTRSGPAYQMHQP